MNKKDAVRCVSLFFDAHWSALASCYNNQPLASMVAFATSSEPLQCIFHLSQLAKHTQYLLKNPQASIVISENKPELEDPQQQARLTVSGRITQLAPDSENYLFYRQLYLEKLPDAEMRFSFSDFSLFLLLPQSFNYVGGFARAYEMDNEAFTRVIIKSERKFTDA